MENVYKALRFLFGSINKPSKQESYLVWAKTEYGNDWQFVYQHLLQHNGKPPKKQDYVNTNDNLKGWV